MAAISQTINNVLGGVSQQPDPVKLPGQVREAINAHLDPTFGCVKRPGTKFIGLLSASIPETAEWFPIFRDGKERYIGCIYKDNQVRIRVWNADTAEESTVTIVGNSQDYLDVNNSSSLQTLTINDYTFIINSEKEVTMDTASEDVRDKEALVVINSVAYNTTYAIDFLRDGETLGQVKTFRASRLSVAPASWEVKEPNQEDEGSCAFADTESFVRDGAGTGLGFSLVTSCVPTLIQTEVPGDNFPTSVDFREDLSFNQQSYFVDEFGYAENFAPGSYLYQDVVVKLNEVVNVRLQVEVRVACAGETCKNHTYRVSRVDLADYESPDGFVWPVGITFADLKDIPAGFKNREDGAELPAQTVGMAYEIVKVDTPDPTIEFSYKSVYRTQVTLNAGGLDWSVGDTVTVNMRNKDYVVKVEETSFFYTYEAEATASYTTPANTDSGPLDVSLIVSTLSNLINELPDYQSIPIGNVIIIKRLDERDFNLQTRGGAADSAIYAIKDSVNDVSRLPAQCEDGVLLKVSNSDDSAADDYYVKFKTEGGIPGQGSWIETIKPGIATDLNASTMPHVLERDAAGVFQLRPLTKEYNDKNFWAPRDAGDDKTNPAPTFVGKKIKDAVFYLNRLGFLSNDTIVLSQAGDYFNFFQGSAIAISDADPIDMSVSTTKPSTLKAAMATPAGLLLFAENSQFLMKSEDVAFGPSTARMDEITSYAYRSDVQPVETGVSVLFTTSADTFSKVFELSVDSLNSRPLVSENTRIVPEYIPPDLKWCISVPNNSLVLMGTGNTDVYAFRFYNTGDERQLAGWTKWTFANQIKMSYFDHDTGFFVERGPNGQTTLSKMELLDDPKNSAITAFGTNFTPRLDDFVYQKDLTIETIDSKTSRIRFPLGFNPTGSDITVVSTASSSATYASFFTPEYDGTSQYIVADSRVLDTLFIAGVPYTMEITLPSFYIKEGDRNRADRRFPPMVEFANIDLYLSGRYSVDIIKQGYDNHTIDLDVTDADIYKANDAALSLNSTRQIPVFSRGDMVTLVVKAPDPLPAAITSYSWEGHYSTRGIARR